MNNTFDKLPIEVTRLILHRLDLRTKITARRVCWLWNEIIDETLRFNVLLTKDNLKYYDKLYNEVYSMRVRNLNVTLRRELGKFRAGGGSIVAKHPKCLIFDSSNKGIFGKNISTLLMLNSTLEFLEFRKNSLRFIQKPLGVDGVIMPNLTELRLKLGHTFHMKIASGLAKMKMPCLKTLSLVCSSSFNCMCGKLNSRVYFDFYRFLANITDTLEKLVLVHPKTHKYRYDPFINALEYKELEGIGMNVQKANLTELQVAFASIENKEGYASLGLQLAMAQRRLTKLELKIIGQTMRPKMDEIIRQNSSTLTSLIVTYTTFKMDYSQFDCEVLSMCSKLETLKIQNFYVLHPEQLPKGLKIWTTFGSFIQNPLTIITTNLTQLRELAFLPYEWETYNNVNFLQAFEQLIKMPKLTRFEIFTPHGGTVLEALFWNHPLIHVICPNTLDLRTYFLKLPHYRSYSKDFLMPTIVAHIIK